MLADETNDTDKSSQFTRQSPIKLESYKLPLYKQTGVIRFIC